MSEEVNKKLPARTMTVQLLTIYTDLDSHNAHTRMERQTDGRTDGQTTS